MSIQTQCTPPGRPVYVAGVGMTKFAKSHDAAGRKLAASAIRDALTDGGIVWSEVGLLVAGVVGGEMGFAPSIVHELGWTGVPAHVVENASATGSAAFDDAYAAVATGCASSAVAVGCGSLASALDGAANLQGRIDLAAISGNNLPPTTFAMLKRQRMHDYGEPDDAALTVVAKNLHHASLNPLAQRRTAVPVAELKSSPMFAEPLRRVECCPIGDGAAAVVLTAEPPQNAAVAVRVAAATSGTDQWHPAASCAPDPEITRRVADAAYRLAGITADDLDLIELHDAFSVEELQYLEDLGVCPPGQAGKQMLAGKFGLGGRVAVNTSGGLIARGHPGGATGLAQIVELATQLRGAAGERHTAAPESVLHR
ncbi:thiolase family protein [Mycobacterium sp. Lab-001]|uniref:thiolase family protein n=1 Tax=Mycobacterium sp. Lab-001 TaxID=3410136 RepID=UPI003D1785B0